MTYFDLSILLSSISLPNLTMEPAKNLELIDQAIKKLLAEKRNKESSGDDGFLQDDNDQLLLSKLLSEVYEREKNLQGTLKSFSCVIDFQ